MRARTSAALLLLAALAAACATPASGTVEGAVLRYGYAPGADLAYELEAAMSLDMTAAGNPQAAGAMEAEMDMSVTGRLDLAFAVGPTPDTIEITIAQELLEGGARITTMGEEVLIPLADLAAQMEEEMVLVVDAQGRPIAASIDGIALPARLLSGLSGFTGGQMLTPQQFGPEFPDTPLYVGASWETDQSADVLGLPFTQHGEHEVVAEEEIEGRHVYRIDSRLTTGAIRTDLAALLAALAQYPEMLGGSDPAELEAGLAQFESMGVGVAIEMREATSTMTTWFDPAAGIVVRAALDNPMTMTMSMRGIPGGDVEVIMDMRSEQRLTLAA